MKNTLSNLALATAVCITLGGAAQSASACDQSARQHRYSVREYDRAPMVAERTDRPFLERVVTWPFRAAYTVVKTPVIIGETVAGERTFVTDDGRFLARRDLARGERIAYRDIDYGPRRVVRSTARTGEHAAVSTRRLAHRTSRSLEHAGETTKHVAKRTGNTLERAGESTGRGIVRTGRTITHTPRIIGETLTGERHVVSREGRMFASNR